MVIFTAGSRPVKTPADQPVQPLPVLSQGIGVLALFALAACRGESPTAPPPPVASVSVSPPTATVAPGGTLQLTATPEDAVGNPLSGHVVTWSSTNPSVATVSSTGLVAGVAPGSTTISARSEGKAGTASVTVSAVPIVSVGSWTSIGPHHINGRTDVESGKLQTLAVFAGDPRIMYAGGGLGSGDEGPVTEAGAFKTTDGGAHWTAIGAGLADPMVNALWVDQDNSNVVLAGTEFGGIFKSIDGGMNWALTGNLGATSEFVSASGKVLAATAAGLAQSADLGTTWAVVLPTVSPVRALAAGGGAVVVGLQNGTVMMQSTPTGVWHSATPGPDVVAVALDASNPTSAYAVISCCPGTLAGTSNGGLTWSPIPIPSGPQAILMTSDTHILYAAGGGFMVSTSNAGQSWTAIPNAIWDNRRIFVVPGQSTIILGTDQGLHGTTNDGGTWTDLSGSISASILTGVAVRDRMILTAVQDFSPIVSFDAGDSWQQPVWTSANAPVGEDGQVLINPANANYCYAFTTAGYQFSTDACRTFNPPGISGYVQPGGTNMIAVDGLAPSNVYVASQSGVYRSTDWGVTMTATKWPLAQPTAIAVDPTDSRTIYVGTSSALYQTQDGGTTWSRLSLAGALGYPTTIAIDPRNAQTVLVGLSVGPGGGGGVLRSVDRGYTFRAVNTGLASIVRNFECCGVDVYSVRFNAGSVAALATRTGIYVSANFGDTWQNVTGISVPTFFTDVAWDGGYLYAATFGEGVLQAPVTVAPSPVLRNQRSYNRGQFMHRQRLRP